MIAWVKAHLDESHTDLSLSDENIRDYLSTLDRSYVIGRDFLGEIPSPWGRKHTSSSSNGKGKQPKVLHNPPSSRGDAPQGVTLGARQFANKDSASSCTRRSLSLQLRGA